MRKGVISVALLSGAIAGAPPTSQSQRLEPGLRPATLEALEEALAMSYLDLLEEAAYFEFNSVQIRSMRDQLARAEAECVRASRRSWHALRADRRRAERALRQNTDRLAKRQLDELERRLQYLRIEEERHMRFFRDAVPLAYDHYRTKLDLLGQWPAQMRQVHNETISGYYVRRQWGDVHDIGFREIRKRQDKDLVRGKLAANEMRRLGMLARTVEQASIVSFVTDLAQKIAQRSDIAVPLQVTILDSPEINAFALPGGYLFVHRGLLEAVDDESQLAGVLAHEIAHVTARHGHRLMQKPSVTSVMYQPAQFAAFLFTRGSVGLGTYYALKYRLRDLKPVLSLDSLGVNRKYEAEADQLGVQYAWNSGYDPSGFIRFFDKMATGDGFLDSAAWFRTHPPSYERMARAKREIRFLSSSKDSVVQTHAFDEFQATVKIQFGRAAKGAGKGEAAGRPMLLGATAYAPEAPATGPSRLKPCAIAAQPKP